jgi:dihydrolipoamide dehydrogenase
MGKKIIVVGGGPGGYVAAIRAAQLGAEVHLVEAEKLGGTCLNVGCIPTKALLHTADFYKTAAANSVAGVKVNSLELDWPEALAHKEKIVSRLTNGVSALLRYNKVAVHPGRAKILPGLKVQVGGETLAGDAVVLATGSENASIRFPGCDLEGVIDSTGALNLQEPPKSLVIVGGGVIGIEFAALYGALGTEVTILEMMEEILPPVDRQISKFLHKHLERSGVRIFTKAKLTSVEKAGLQLRAEFEHAGEKKNAVADKVLVVVGRRPRTKGLGLEALGVKMERGAICVGDAFETNLPGLYAVGDCNAKLMLAHAASAQGKAAVEHIMGHKPSYHAGAIPSCIYCTPEISAVGMTEEQAKAAGVRYKVGLFDLNGNGKSLIEGKGGGMIKIIADSELGEVLGVHMIGPHVTDMIAEAALCMNLEGTVEDIAHSTHPHPTVSEAVEEAAMAVFGKAIHSI